MKIALCLSGIPQPWPRTWRTLHTYFSAYKSQMDVFLHLWKDEVNEDLRTTLEDVYRPKAVVVTSRPDADAQKRTLAERFPSRPHPYSFDMFEAIKQSVQLALNGDYKYVIRARIDAVFDGACPADLFPSNPNEIIVPNNYTPPNGCNDQFASGHVTAMRVYTNMIEWLMPLIADQKAFYAALPDSRFASNPDIFRPEQALAAYLERAGLHVRALPLRVKLLRKRDFELGTPFDDLPQDLYEGSNLEVEREKKRRDDEALGRLPSEAGRLSTDPKIGKLNHE